MLPSIASFSSGTSKNILVIDDTPHILTLLRTILMRQGFAVRTAPNGIEGLAVALYHTPDLIICDYAMADLTGLDVLRELKTTPSLAQCPFILMSTHPEYFFTEAPKPLPVDGFIKKPFSLDNMFETIHAVLDKHLHTQAAALADRLTTDTAPVRETTPNTPVGIPQGRALLQTERL